MELACSKVAGQHKAVGGILPLHDTMVNFCVKMAGYQINNIHDFGK